MTDERNHQRARDDQTRAEQIRLQLALAALADEYAARAVVEAPDGAKTAFDERPITNDLGGASLVATGTNRSRTWAWVAAAVTVAVLGGGLLIAHPGSPGQDREEVASAAQVTAPVAAVASTTTTTRPPAVAADGRTELGYLPAGLTVSDVQEFPLDQGGKRIVTHLIESFDPQTPPETRAPWTPVRMATLVVFIVRSADMIDRVRLDPTFQPITLSQGRSAYLSGTVQQPWPWQRLMWAETPSLLVQIETTGLAGGEITKIAEAMRAG